MDVDSLFNLDRFSGHDQLRRVGNVREHELSNQKCLCISR
jgi:hypothetical protein